MAKAIFVMDMPKSCDECCICASWQPSAFSTREYWCPVMNNKDVEPDKKPSWCPLKPMPEKFEGWLSDRGRGWNACIDEICGEE